MLKTEVKEVLPADLHEHRAVQTWRQIQSEWFEPESIEVLKSKRKSAVYRLTGGGPSGMTIIAKRSSAATVLVEHAVYEEVLTRLPLAALRCYGFAREPDTEYCWLFLQDAAGPEYSPANGEHRELAARWLATLHRVPVSAELQAALPDRGPNHYLNLLRDGREVLVTRVEHPALSAEEVALLRKVTEQLDAAEQHWGELETFCAAWPRAVVHGDFVIKNLRLRNGDRGPALLVYDWEMAGWGVPATDLAQSLGRCVSPDLDVYGSTLRQDFPQFDARDLRRLANYGNLLRVVDKIYWATVAMENDDYLFLIKPLSMIQGFEPQLAASLRAINWT